MWAPSCWSRVTAKWLADGLRSRRSRGRQANVRGHDLQLLVPDEPIVTVAAMKLVEQGRLGLDDPVTRWLPDFKPTLPDGSTPVITVRQLLTHTAGLSYRFYETVDSDCVRADVSDRLISPPRTGSRACLDSLMERRFCERLFQVDEIGCWVVGRFPCLFTSAGYIYIPPTIVRRSAQLV